MEHRNALLVDMNPLTEASGYAESDAAREMLSPAPRTQTPVPNSQRHVQPDREPAFLRVSRSSCDRSWLGISVVASFGGRRCYASSAWIACVKRCPVRGAGSDR